MKALIFVLFAFLLPSCSLFEPVTDPVTTRTERLVEGYTPSGTADLVIRGDYTQSVINVDSFFLTPDAFQSTLKRYYITPPLQSEPGVIYFDSDTQRYMRLDISPYNEGTAGIYTPSGTPDSSYSNMVYINVDSIFTPTEPQTIDYWVVSPESNVGLIQLMYSSSIVAGYSYDSDGRSTEFILSCTLSPWNRDNEQVYDTVFGPLRIVTDPVIFLPYRGRISIGGREWMIK